MEVWDVELCFFSDQTRELSDFMVPKEIEVRMKSTMKPLVSVQCTCRFMANVYSRLSYNLRLMSSVAVQSCGLCVIQMSGCLGVI